MFVKLKVLIVIFNFLHGSSPQTMRSSGAVVLGYFDTPLPQGNAVSRKTYYLTSIFTTTWIEAFNFCAASTMSLATFDTQAQLDSFITMMQANAAQFTLCSGLYIGAVATAQPVSTTSWAWVDSGKTTGLTFPWASGYPTKTGYCMLIRLISGVATVVNGVCNNNPCSFACTDTKIITPNVTWTSTSANVLSQAKLKGLSTLATTVVGWFF